MTIQVEWMDDTQTVVRQIFNGTWTWDDFYKTSTESKQLIASVEQIVHIFSDMRESESLPMSGVLVHARNVLSNMPANWGLLVIITRNSFIRAMVSTFTSVFRTTTGKKIFAVATLDEANALIERYQPQNNHKETA